MRHLADPELGQILNWFRDGDPDHVDDVYHYLLRRCLDLNNDLGDDNENAIHNTLTKNQDPTWDEAYHMFLTNKLAEQHNDAMIRRHHAQYRDPVLKIGAKDTHPREHIKKCESVDAYGERIPCTNE
eukprot:tig00021337_g20361.t1